MFGLFTRKSTLDDTSESRTSAQNARLPTPTPSIASVTHQSPLRFQTVFRGVLGGSTTSLPLRESDLATHNVAEGVNNGHSFAPPPPVTPSPPPVGSGETKALHDLMLTIPPKTLHAYTLTHLRPQVPLPSTSSPALGLHPDNMPRPPSPQTVDKLIHFFSALAPPPLLHCMRCHKDFYEIENEEKDKACRVAHDDESALVSRVSGGGGYETLWGCCGQTAPGDGSEGPPDGWCYEGRHTTDVRRARFRADSTIHDDRLTSCLKLNCRGARDQLPRAHGSPASPFGLVGTSSSRRSNASPTRSQVSRTARKRPRKSLKEASSSENEGDGASSGGRVAQPKDDPKTSRSRTEDEGTRTTLDEANSPNPNPKLKPKTKTKSRPVSRVRPSHSSSTMASLPGTPASIVKARTGTASAKLKSTSRTLLSQSQTHLPSDSETSTRARPRTRSHVREESRVRDTSRSRPASKMTVDVSERTRRTRKATKPASSEEEAEAETDAHQESEQEERGRDRKKRRLRRS